MCVFQYLLDVFHESEQFSLRSVIKVHEEGQVDLAQQEGFNQALRTPSI